MIIKYQKIIEKFSDGSSTTHDLNEPDYQDSDSRCTELATIDGVTYVHVPDDVTLPDQPAQINVEEVTLTPELKEQIKAASPHVRLSYKRLQERIRSRYSLEDEQYLTRISIGALSGTYAMQEDEPALIAAYQVWVEECREIARLERTAWGL
jgi:hypothetical protein